MTEKMFKFAKKNKLVTVALIIAILVGTSLLSGINLQPTSNSIVTPGWEIYDQISGMSYQNSNTVLTQANQFTSPNFISGVQWKVDSDDPNSGYPTLQIEVGDIFHINFAGQVTPNSQPAATLSKTVGNHVYQLDDHIYEFTVTVRTVADVADKGTGGNGYHVWSHETSWANVGLSSLAGLTNPIMPPYNGANVGKQYNGVIYPKFVINPWTASSDTTTAPTGYRINNAWAGVMNSYVLKADAGQINNQWGDKPNPSAEAPMFYKAGIDPGNQVPMFKDDGTYGSSSPVVTWDSSLAPTLRSPSTVVLGLPTQLQAGAYLTKDIWGGVTAITPCDVYIMYTLRVDVLQTHDYILQTSINPPSPTPPADFYSWVKSFWDGLFDGLFNPFGNTSWVVWIIILVIAVVAFYFLILKRNKNPEKQGITKNKYFGLSPFDWIVVGALGILTFIPDPVDAVTGGIPLIEPIAAASYYIWRKKKNNIGA